MSEYKKVENAKAELTTSVEGEIWEQAQKTAFKKLSKNVEIRGFRKGQAPAKLVRQQLSEGRILLEAAEELAQAELEKAVKEHQVELIDRPDLKIDTITNEKLVLTFVCPVKPDVEINDYKGLPYNEEETVVTEEDVQKQLDAIRENKAELELKEDGSAAEGDTVVIDYVGTINGVAFDGGSAENYELTLGSHSFIPGFEEAIVGMNSEEEKDITLTFPEDYHAENLKGKEAVFHVTVHEIKTKVLPELTEDIIEELNIKDVHTLDELKKYIHDGVFKQRKRENESKARGELFDKLNEKATIEVPEKMVEQELDGMVNDYERQWTYQVNNPGFKFDEKMKATLRKNMKDEALKRVRISLILEEIGRRENIQVSDEEVEEEYNKLADEYGMTANDLKKYMPKNFLLSDLKDRKTVELLKNK